jgi:hypothetical protein
MKNLNIWNSATQAIKEATRLQQQSINHQQFNKFMVVMHDKNNYVVELFSWEARDAALKNNSLLIVI